MTNLEVWADHINAWLSDREGNKVIITKTSGAQVGLSHQHKAEAKAGAIYIKANHPSARTFEIINQHHLEDIRFSMVGDREA